ncbi:TPA: hypothetical protein MW242_003030 [Acinetobacter baumannii]|nr:hypothetical protein [Acinetobacter baumannii]
MNSSRVLIDYKYLNTIFKQFIQNHPRPLSVKDILSSVHTEAKLADRGLKRAIQRIVKIWHELGILKQFIQVTRGSEKFYCLSETGELFVANCRVNNTKSLFDNQNFINGKRDISFRYFFITYFSINLEETFTVFTPQKIKQVADLLGYSLTLRSWQRTLHEFNQADLLKSKLLIHKTTAFELSNSCFNLFKIPHKHIDVIQFERKLIDIGFIKNYENYIDYNKLAFLKLFDCWCNNPGSFHRNAISYMIR